MEVFSYDFSNLFSFSIIAAILLGTLVGLVIGALPGLGASIAIVLLLPFTYTLDPLVAILLLLAAYQASEYGGSISSIVLGIPGTGAAVATMLDGNPLAKTQGPGKALGYSLFSSSIGGIIGGLALLLLTVPLMKFALKLSDPEYFLLGILGILAVGALSSKDIVKSMIFAVLGLLLGTIGMDTFTGSLRFTFGRPELMEGINIIPLIIGMFAFTEIFNMINDGVNKKYITDSKKVGLRLPIRELKKTVKPIGIGIGSVIGTCIGIFPGLATGASTWFSYLTAKKFSKSPETFGKGNPEGIMAPEAANNATVGGALIPMLSLNIPGTPGMAIVMGALLIHGIQPGPGIITRDPNLVYGIFYGFLLTCIAMFIVGILVTSLFAKVLVVPIHFLVPILITISLVGVYASQGMVFELWFAFISGIIFFFMTKIDFALPGFILAFVLSPIIEESLRRTLILSDGSYLIFFQRTYSLILILIILAIIVFFFLKKMKGSNNSQDKTISS